MNEIIKINNHDVTAKEYNGMRVVTFKDIDTVHERPEGTAKRNFNENKKRFVKGTDYFLVSASEIRTNKIMDISDKAHQDMVLITESGYLMLVKSFTDDLAWEVQRQLVNSYFKAKDAFENMSIELRAVIVVDQRVTKIEKKVERLEYDIPLYGSEADEICNHVKRKGVEMLGGKQSNSYKDSKVRTAVYTDIYNQIKREFGLYDDSGRYKSYKALKRRYIYDAHELIDAYELPTYLSERVTDCNAQMKLAV